MKEQKLYISGFSYKKSLPLLLGMHTCLVGVLATTLSTNTYVILQGLAELVKGNIYSSPLIIASSKESVGKSRIRKPSFIVDQ